MNLKAKSAYSEAWKRVTPLKVVLLMSVKEGKTCDCRAVLLVLAFRTEQDYLTSKTWWSLSIKFKAVGRWLFPSRITAISFPGSESCLSTFKSEIRKSFFQSLDCNRCSF